MSSSNGRIAEILRRYARTLELQGVDRFKVKAYKRAAATVETLADDVSKLVLAGEDLTQIPNIGKAISQIVHEIVSTGTLKRLEITSGELPPEMAELTTRPGLDPKRV